MASTGLGTDSCIRRGCLPARIDFYSPIPDIRDLESRQIWEKRSELVGIDFDAEAQLQLLATLGREFGHECGWPTTPQDAPAFYVEPNSFSYGCAASTHCMIRHFKPKRVIEIGSGYSTRLIASSLQMNYKENGITTKYLIVDPYADKRLNEWLPPYAEIVNRRVELLDIEFFSDLEKNDILFIDTGHAVRTGGDVNFEILDILPRLMPGVIVHFHDIPLPNDYPKANFTNPRFRVFWTEAYLLQAFLCFNHDYEVLLGMNYLMNEHSHAFRADFPPYDQEKYTTQISGSFWIRRHIKMRQVHALR
jgi:hypothetical protein